MPAENLDIAALGIGSTPMINLSHLVRAGALLMKAEFRNPFGSAKDRTAAYLLNWAFSTARPDVQVVESTSGNLGYALANLGKIGGFTPILVVDPAVSARQRERIAALGARVELVLAAWPGLDLRQTRTALAREIGSKPGHIWLNQYGNEAGLLAHRQTTGPEIWEQAQAAGRQVEVFIAPVSTGGTICGAGQYLKERDPRVRVIGVEPSGSSIFGGSYCSSYLVAGAGMRGPSQLMVDHASVIDSYAKVPDSVAAAYAAYIRDECGLPIGLSAGAAMSVAVCIAEQDANVVVIAPDTSACFKAEIDELAAASPPARSLPAIQVTPASDIPWAELSAREYDPRDSQADRPRQPAG